MALASDSKIPVSVIIITKNEASGIGECIDSFGNFAEVVVVDSNSTDETVQIAKEHGARVVRFVWNGSYPKKKQWSLDNVDTRHEWVLLVDADERATKGLEADIRRREREMALGTCSAYDISLEYVFAGRVLKHGHTVRKRSLLNKSQVAFEKVDDLDSTLGEVEGHYQPVVQGKVGQLKGRLHHEDKDPIRTWIDRHNKYSDWESFIASDVRVANQVNSHRSKQGKVFAATPAKPVAFFVYDYVVKQGFRDGRAGFDYAIALAWYYWVTGVKTRERISANAEVNR